MIPTSNVKYLIPGDENGIPIYNSWLVKIDPVNKTMQWRDIWKVDSLDTKEKKRIEDEYSKEYPDYNWMKQYLAQKNNGASSTVWATSKADASSLFDRMHVQYEDVKVME